MAETPATGQQALTVRELHEKLGSYLDIYGDRPVHILDMDQDDESTAGGLVTEVEIDCFDDAQGLVVSLLSWPNKDRIT